MKILVVGLFTAISLAHAGEGKGALPTCKQIQKSFSVKSPKVKTKSSNFKTANKAPAKKAPVLKAPVKVPSVSDQSSKSSPNDLVKLNEPITENIAPTAVLPAQPPLEGQVLETPMLTQEQLSELFFDPNRKVTFELTWNQNTKLDKKIAVKHGSDQSVLFQELSRNRLFALMFADLYLMNRAKLEQEAQKNLSANQRWVIQIYFQRFQSDMNEFGSFAWSISEKECIDWLLAGSPYRESSSGMSFGMVCAPGIQVHLSLMEGDRVLQVQEIVPMVALPYGPGTGRPVMTVNDVLRGMGKILGYGSN